MISELSLIRRFTSFWNQLIPGCDSYVRLINEELFTRFEKPLRYNENILNRALINNVSFNLFKEMLSGKLKRKDLGKIDDKDSFNKLVNKERVFLSRFSQQVNPQLPFLESEIKSIKTISLRLYDQFKSEKAVVLSPVFAGSGILKMVEGDILVGNTLVEVKSGERKFSVYDVRQLLVYCALNYQNKNYGIEEIELLNPRTGVFFAETVKEISMRTGSMSPEELFSEIIYFVSENNFVEEI